MKKTRFYMPTTDSKTEMLQTKRSFLVPVSGLGILDGYITLRMVEYGIVIMSKMIIVDEMVELGLSVVIQPYQLSYMDIPKNTEVASIADYIKENRKKAHNTMFEKAFPDKSFPGVQGIVEYVVANSDTIDLVSNRPSGVIYITRMANPEVTLLTVSSRIMSGTIKGPCVFNSTSAIYDEYANPYLLNKLSFADALQARIIDVVNAAPPEFVLSESIIKGERDRLRTYYYAKSAQNTTSSYVRKTIEKAAETFNYSNYAITGPSSDYSIPFKDKSISNLDSMSIEKKSQFAGTAKELRTTKKKKKQIDTRNLVREIDF